MVLAKYVVIFPMLRFMWDQLVELEVAAGLLPPGFLATILACILSCFLFITFPLFG